MAIFNCYVSSPEGIKWIQMEKFGDALGVPHFRKPLHDDVLVELFTWRAVGKSLHYLWSCLIANSRN